MGCMALFRVCLLLAMMFRSASQRIGKPITCVAGTFVRGQPAAITCNLQAVNAAGSGVNLKHYPPGSSDFDPGNNILMCSWEQEEKSHHCAVKNGYEFDHKIKDSLTVNIAAVSDSNAGLHMCFLVPPDGTDSHACELFVKVASNVTTMPRINKDIPSNEGDNDLPWLVTGFAIVTVVAVFAVATAVYFKRSRSKRTALHNSDDHHPLTQLVNKEVAASTPLPLEPSNSYPKEQVEALIKGFRLQNEDLQRIMEILKKELDAKEETSPKANITMFPTILPNLPNKTETGEVLVVNLSSRWLKILLVKMDHSEIICETMTYEIRGSIRLGTSERLFDFIANRVQMFLTSLDRGNDNFNLAFVFSFPLKYDEDGDLTKARLVRWTKGFKCTGVVNTNLVKLLQQALKKKECNVVIKAVVNDTVGVLVSGVHMDLQCKISFIHGNGVNGCYLSKNDNSKGKVIISTEWGALRKPNLPDIYITEFDMELDKCSVNPNEQTLEKMVSRLYIGGIVRLVLLRLIKDKLLFNSFYCDLPTFSEKSGFTTEHVMMIQSDSSEHLDVTRQVLTELRVQSFNEDDCKIVKHVCEIVVQRAAFLAAAALATIIRHTGQQHVTVAIEGSLYRLNPMVKDLVQEKTLQLINKACEVKFITTLDGSSKGAALTVACSESLCGTNTTKPK